jgi:DNA-binding response OmpR family regulator
VNSSHRILLIEDDPAVARSLQHGLEREGHVVVWEALGAEGIEHACDHNRQLIILDVPLPDGSGLDFCRSMRQMGLRHPILTLTVRREEMDRVLGLEMGAEDHVTKPYSLRELLSRIRALLRRAFGELSIVDPDLLNAGDLVVGRGRGQA